jgi:hypothetical protein
MIAIKVRKKEKTITMFGMDKHGIAIITYSLSSQ